MYSGNTLLKPILIQAIVVDAYMCMDLISRKHRSRIKKNIHVCFGEGGSKEMTRFHFFANIGNYKRPLMQHETSQDSVVVWLRQHADFPTLRPGKCALRWWSRQFFRKKIYFSEFGSNCDRNTPWYPLDKT